MVFFFFVLRISLQKLVTKKFSTRGQDGYLYICVYMWHVRSFIYHSVSDIHIYIAELGRRWKRVQGPRSSKKFITVTEYKVPNPTRFFFLALIRLPSHLRRHRRLGFKSANLMDRRTYEDIIQKGAHTAYCIPTYDYNMRSFKRLHMRISTRVFLE